jgi:hypothetical protein
MTFLFNSPPSSHDNHQMTPEGTADECCRWFTLNSMSGDIISVLILVVLHHTPIRLSTTSDVIIIIIIISGTIHDKPAASPGLPLTCPPTSCSGTQQGLQRAGCNAAHCCCVLCLR